MSQRCKPLRTQPQVSECVCRLCQRVFMCLFVCRLYPSCGSVSRYK